MKSTQTMLGICFVTILLGVFPGCARTKTGLVAPGVHTAPYDQRFGEVTWAVAPLRNESGTTVVDALALSDVLVATVQEVRGVRALPVNRTIEAMRSLGIEGDVLTEGQARDLARTLGATGIIVGSITAYDPYDPPSIGLSLALMTETVGEAAALDPRALAMAPTDAAGASNTNNFGKQDSVVASEHLDARSHEVLLRVQQYAEGRNDGRSAVGWRIYLASMDLYTRFATYELVGQLLDEEWLRLARESTRQAKGG